jgi:Rrf2 family iron-sulfur cluster assembly transcriptional regulator
MWLNRTSQSAIRAVVYIAGHAQDSPVRVDEIARSLRTPRNYLSKTLHLLTRAGILRSARGPKGGFQLTDRPERVALSRVIAPFEPASERRCLLGRPECGGTHRCFAHDRWTRTAGLVEDFFASTTVADLLAEERSGTATVPQRRARAGSRAR